MARWTESIADVRHYATISAQYMEIMGTSAKLRVTLANGSYFEGFFGLFNVRRSHPGNAFAGEFEVIDPSTNQPVTVDMLDVLKIEAV